MSYKALYRTYRPQSFKDVAGQQHIVKTLMNAFNENKIAHAYLFCGPRGTGKTTMARLFAKALNCEKGFGFQCNECFNCKSISEGSHPDIIEIDAASNRGIDDIRDIINKVKYSPIRGKWKVYIIDEVHMMTTEAFNALLKTLEEPPENVVFILCTTEPYKLMPTILSRVQRYDFTKISNQDLFSNLKKVCVKENIEVEDEALNIIVSLADGGGRDSLSMLDQAIAYSSKKLELHHVQELFGLSTIQEKMELLYALDKSDILLVTNKFDYLCTHGIDIKRFTFDLIEIVKDLLIYRTTKDTSILKVINSDIVHSTNISKDKLLYMLDILMDCYSQFRLVSDIKSIIEVAFLKIASYGDSNSSTQEEVLAKEIKKEVQKNPIAPSNSVEKPNFVQVQKPLNEDNVIVKKEIKPLKVNMGESIPLKELDGTPIEISDDDVINIMVQASKQEKNEVLEVWDTLKNYLQDANYGIYASLLQSCSPRVVAKNAIVLETSFNGVAQKISYKENQKALSKLLELLTGKKYYILVLHSGKMIDTIQKFTNLRQISKLPSPKEIFFDFSISNQEGTKKIKSETEMFVEELNKGDLLLRDSSKK